jgi:predicted Zn finger-like uncharacterized protein
MYTQCPHCQTCFRISEAHLKVADGKVRCGSCQEVFDATQYLFKNLTDREPITDFKQPAPPPAAPPPPPAPPPQQSATEHIDLSAPSPTPEQTLEEIRRERAESPDQGQFMESTVGSDRYNDLDNMESISIPGDINFGDSMIKFAEQAAVPDEPEQPAEERTPYEDIEDKESPATTADMESIKDFYAQVDAQLHDKKEDNDEDKRSQLDKDIDELLAFAKDLDQESDLSKPEPTKHDAGAKQPDEHTGTESEEEFDLHAIAEFEKELEATSTGVFAAQDLQAEQLQEEQPAEQEPAQPEQTTAKPLIAKATAKSANENASLSDDDKQTKRSDFDELASPDEDIPLALRRSLDSLNDLPRRSLGMTLLMLLIIIVLIGGLGFQVVLFRNVELAQRFPTLIPC